MCTDSYFRDVDAVGSFVSMVIHTMNMNIHVMPFNIHIGIVFPVVMASFVIVNITRSRSSVSAQNLSIL